MTIMRYVIFFYALVAMTGCARFRVTNEMQPDLSYRVLAKGNGYSSVEDARAVAKQRAAALCPSGYKKVSEAGEDGSYPTYQIIVKCEESR